MQIRRLVPGDQDAAALLERLCFGEPWSAATLLAALENPRAALFGVTVPDAPAGQLAGYAGMHSVLDEGYVDNVAVHPDCWGHGFGTALVDTLCAYAAQEGLTFLTLEVRASHTPAIKLYERAGFVRVGMRPRFYSFPTEDALLMTRYFVPKEQPDEHISN